MTSNEIYAMFKKGTRVEVVRCISYKKYDYRGKIGTVVCNNYGAYGKILVELDHETNPYSVAGHFYFKPHELSLVNECNDDNLEGNNMQNVVNYFNIAKIQYLDNSIPSKYDYANFDPYLEAGNLCVVKSLNHGLGLAKVVEIVNENNIQTPREIVSRVDTEAYDQRVESRKLAADLKAKMQERAKQLQDIALYQMLAKDDPDMQDLLDRYQSLPLY